MDRVEEVKLLTARQVMRPQVQFKHLIDNTDTPFVPRLTEKPHALKPLSILVEYDDKEISQESVVVATFTLKSGLRHIRGTLTKNIYRHGRYRGKFTNMDWLNLRNIFTKYQTRLSRNCK